MENNFFSPAQAIKNNTTYGAHKLQNSLKKTVVLGIIAGMFISIGAQASNFAMQTISDYGVAKVVAGCIFPVGLMMIILLGAELFTSDCLLAFNVFNKDCGFGKVFIRLGVIFVSNFIGALIVAFLVFSSHQFDSSHGALGALTIKYAVGKNSFDFFTAFCSGIMCNILVCISTLMAATAKDIAGKIFAIFFPIFAFIVSGFEHCVANMYYIPAGILASTNPEYVKLANELYHITPDQITSLQSCNFLVNNLIPVTIGNIVGGMIFVALPLFFLNKDENH